MNEDPSRKRLGRGLAALIGEIDKPAQPTRPVASADSRVPIAEMGLEQVPMSAIRGQPLFYYWGSDNSRMGEPRNR